MAVDHLHRLWRFAGLTGLLASFSLASVACLPRRIQSISAVKDASTANVDPSDPASVAGFAPSSPPGTDDPRCGDHFDVNASGGQLSPDVLAQRDEIYQLMAYAVVLKDWEFPEKTPRRGYNIGGVMIDQNWQVVWWDRNSDTATCNGSQHGETRMMTGYLDFVDADDLRCHQIFTSLEPCAMCSGMMTLQRIRRTVYGETDFEFGKAIERLDQAFGPSSRGYPRVPTSVASPSEFRKALETEQQVLATGATSLQSSPAANNVKIRVPNLTDYLLTDGTGENDKCATDVFGADGTKALSDTDAAAAVALVTQGKIGCAKRLYAGATYAFLNYDSYIRHRKDPFSLTFHPDPSAPGGISADPDSGTALATPPLDRTRNGVALPSELLPDNSDLYRRAVVFYQTQVTAFYLSTSDHINASQQGRPPQPSVPATCHRNDVVVQALEAAKTTQ